MKPAPSEPAGAKAGKVGKKSKRKQEWSVSCLWDSALLYSAVSSKVLCVCCREDDFDMETALTEIQTSEAERSPIKSEGSTRYVAKH